MVITRTPFRISFFGGGTDHPAWYKDNKGAVLSTTIDKYCYINLRYLPPFFEHRYRIVYSKIESVKNISQIQHPAVKVLLDRFKIKKGVEIHHDGDLPARSGLGSSSAFTVGMLNALHALMGKIVPKTELAKEAIHVERDLLHENVGSQDQIAAAFGGFNKIIFDEQHNFRIEPITLHREKIKQLQKHLMLFYTGLTRFSSDIAAAQLKNISKKSYSLGIMHRMVDEAIGILNSKRDILEFGKLLHDFWQLKKGLSEKISNPIIEDLYALSLKNGAIGGKILGAGGGGFVLLFAPPERQKKIRNALKKFLHVAFAFENTGSQVIYYNPE